MSEKPFLNISYQAKKRGISVQELLRAVIVPEWVKENLQALPLPARSTGITPELVAPATGMNSYHRNRKLENTVGQLKY